MFILQEKLIFFPQKLDKNYQFNFDQKFEEVYITTIDSIYLHGILFKADNSKGLIYYLHGNAGSLSSWGEVAATYTGAELCRHIDHVRSRTPQTPEHCRLGTAAALYCWPGTEQRGRGHASYNLLLKQ